MTNKELEKKVSEQKDRQDRLDILYQKLDKDLLNLARVVDKLTDKVEKLKQEPQNYEFKVGDRVEFKSWDEMEKEFGLAASGNIQLPNDWVFNKRMKHFCGTYATIEDIYESGIVELKDMTNDRNKNEWKFTLDMLKPATDEPKCKFKVGDKVEFKPSGQPATIIKIMKDPTMFLIRLWNRVETWVYEKELQPYTEPRWTFTDDEKVILRNLPSGFNWIARDEDDELNIYNVRPPRKSDKFWDCGYCSQLSLEALDSLFQSIKWEDEEPCEFRKYL